MDNLSASTVSRKTSVPRKTEKKPSPKKGAKRSGAPAHDDASVDGELAVEVEPAERDEDADEDAEDEEDDEASHGDESDEGEPGPGVSGDGSESEASDDADAQVHDAPPPSGITRFDAMATYLREVQRHPLLTPDETQRLAIRLAENGDPQAAAALVTANLRLVVKIAYEYRRAYRNIMDLVQEGNIGLMQAVKRYDPYRGVKLSSYAAWWIRAYILRFILNNWRLVKLGTTQAQRKLFFNLRKKRQELQALGIDPTHAEIARQLNVPEQDVAEMDVRLAASEKSLDAPVGDSDGRSISKIDTMATSAQGPEALTADGELQALLKDKLAEFRKTLIGKDKELAIFDDRLVADDPLTLQQLGDQFGVSRERVRQLEQRITGRLRDYLREELGDAAELTSS